MQINQVTRSEDVAYIMEYPRPDERKTLMSSMPSRRPEDEVNIRLLLRSEAVRQICEFIQWGEKTPDNRVEKAGLLYGYLATEDPQAHDQPRRWGVICGIIGANCPKSTQIEVEITGEEWIRMESELDRINADRVAQQKPPFQKMGWFHTHPNWLEPYYSELDYKLQPSLVANADRYGVVFNPHRQKWAVYSGPESKLVCGMMELTDVLLEKYGFQERSVREIRDPGRNPFRIRPKVRPEQEPQDEPGDGDGQRSLNVDTYYTCGEYPPNRVGSERRKVLAASYEKIMIAPTLLGEDCELLAEVNERGRGLEVQPIAGFKKGYEPPYGVKGCVIRFVPSADWGRAIAEYYRSRKWYGGLPTMLVSPDEKICILESGRSASMWGYR